MPIKHSYFLLLEKIRNFFGLMACSIVLHEDFTAVNVKHSEHVLLQHFFHTDRYSFLFLGKKYRPALPISPEKALHTMIESRCFTVGTVNLGSNLLEARGRRPIGDPTRNS